MFHLLVRLQIIESRLELKPKHREIDLGKMQRTLALLVRCPDTSDPRKFASLAFFIV